MSDTRETALAERLREAITVLDEPYHREAVAHVIEEAAAALAASPAPTLAQLRQIEWHGNQTPDLHPTCPACYETFVHRHAKDCWLSLAIHARETARG